MKRSLKHAGEAFKTANLARGLSAARNPPSQAEIEAALGARHARASSAPRTGAQVAQAEAGARQAYEQGLEREAQQARRGSGPAGVAVYGPEVQSPEELARQGVGGSLRLARTELGRQTKQSWRHRCWGARRSRRPTVRASARGSRRGSAPPATRRERRTSRRTASPLHIRRLLHAREDPGRRGPRGT